MKNPPNIAGSVMVGGRFYVAGQEEQLLKAMKGNSVQHLLDKGVLTGDWGHGVPAAPAAASDGPDEARSSPEPASQVAETPASEPTSESTPSESPKPKKSAAKTAKPKTPKAPRSK